MRITAVQTNPTIGDISGIRQEMINQTVLAEKQGSHIVMFPELSTTGYPPLDLLHREDFIDANTETVEEMVRLTASLDTTLVFGCITRNDSPIGNPIFNSVVAARRGRIIARHHKTLLPTYKVFDEDRYFEPGDFDASNFMIFEVQGVPVGILVCEEVWNPLLVSPAERHLYPDDPVKRYCERGTRLLLVVNGSPFRVGVGDQRRDLIRYHAQAYQQTIVYLNQAGANDRLVFDGNSFAMNPKGRVIAWSAAFDKAVMTVNTETTQELEDGYLDMPRPAAVRSAIKLAAVDYMNKQLIHGPACLGMSGGIDSAMVCDYLVDALGPKQVLGLALPSEFNDSEDNGDAETQAKKAGIHFDIIPIKAIHDLYRKAMDDSMLRFLASDELKKFPELRTPVVELSEALQFRNSGTPDENVQSRIRFALLMCWANWQHGLLFSTSNKSELAVGYWTLGGDTGGYALMSDLLKTWVFEQARFANESRNDVWIPQNVIQKPPSAKLRANQTDQQSLPPYEIMDEVIPRYADRDESPRSIIQKMLPQWAPIYPDRNIRADVLKVCYLIDKSQFKRTQTPLGPLLTARDLFFARRYPVVQDFTEYWKSQAMDQK